MANRPRLISMEALEDRTVPAAAFIGNVPIPDPTVPRVSQGSSHHTSVELPQNGPNPALTIGASDDQETLFVQKVYFDFLGRSIDSAAVPYIDALSAGTRSRHDIAQEILHSDEYFAHRIDALYSAFLGRHADDVGLNGYLADVKDGKSLEQVAVDLLSSDEYRALRADDNEFVQAIFNDVLGRAADRAAVDGYVGRLASAAKSEDVRGIIEEIVTSEESRQTAGESAVELMLNQPASVTLGANFVASARDGAAIDSVLADLAASDLYQLVKEVR